jgi:hypothetical protein
MRVTLEASTEAKIVIWRETDMFAAQRVGSENEAQICLGVDLFEVIAELAGLELEVPTQAAEATALAEKAQRRLGASGSSRAERGDLG